IDAAVATGRDLGIGPGARELLHLLLERRREAFRARLEPAALQQRGGMAGELVGTELHDGEIRIGGDEERAQPGARECHLTALQRFQVGPPVHEAEVALLRQQRVAGAVAVAPAGLGLEQRRRLGHDAISLANWERVPAPPVDGPHLVQGVPPFEGDGRLRHAPLIARPSPRLKPHLRPAYSDGAMRTLLSWLSSIAFLPVFGLVLVAFDVAQRVARLFGRRPQEYVAGALQWTLVHTFRICGTRLAVERSPEVRPWTSYIIVSNHQSMFDIPILGSLF